MAKPNQKSLELAELIRRGDIARFEIGQAHHRLRQKLDVPLRIRDSLKSNPLKWLGGSLGVGFVGSLLFSSRRHEPKHEPEKKHRGWFAGLVVMLFTLAKPAIKGYASKLLADYLRDQINARAGRSVSRDGYDPY